MLLIQEAAHPAERFAEDLGQIGKGQPFGFDRRGVSHGPSIAHGGRCPTSSQRPDGVHTRGPDIVPMFTSVTPVTLVDSS
ncbi:hypothetical protein GCM10009807_14660 [Microbacterium lacus]|uniref:Uncharacterized protein n=1 Tax=Microbacterium lacus TaxID=415217 RepID=A0ABN2GHW7_9MICO